MSTRRNPENFPRMKHRARKRIGYRRPWWAGFVAGAPTLLDDGPTLRLFDRDWNLIATARTHSQRRKLFRLATDQVVR